MLNVFQSLLPRENQGKLLHAIYNSLDGNSKNENNDEQFDSRVVCTLRLLERVLLHLGRKIALYYLIVLNLISLGSRELSDPFAAQIATILALLLSMLQALTDVYRSVQVMRCISIIIRNQVRSHTCVASQQVNNDQKHLVVQLHIDSLMSAVAIKAVAIHRQPNKIRMGNVFLGMCRLLETTLVLHRKKLGGRYHLIIRALQCILRCLYVPYNNQKNSGYSVEEEMFYAECGAAHAAAYARLLTSICDPTVSAVSKSKRTSRQELNDETQKARSIAGQHMQYVVKEFCSCQLEGRLLPEMRRALNPGLWAIFDVMPQRVMRNINAAMGSSSRSVFKALYDEYRRSGRWKSGGGNG